MEISEDLATRLQLFLLEVKPALDERSRDLELLCEAEALDELLFPRKRIQLHELPV